MMAERSRFYGSSSFLANAIDMVDTPPENMIYRFAFGLPYSPGLFVYSVESIVNVPPLWT